MSCKCIRILLVAVAPAMLTACNTLDPVSGSTDPAFGEALKYDMAVQTIDPDPVYPADGAQPGDHGAKAAEAVKRYRTDAVKQTQSLSTTSGSGGSGPQ